MGSTGREDSTILGMDRKIPRREATDFQVEGMHTRAAMEEQQPASSSFSGKASVWRQAASESHVSVLSRNQTAAEWLSTSRLEEVMDRPISV